MSCKKILIVLMMLAVINFLQAQELIENNFDHFTKADGLSNNNITGILQDATGYMWLSTSFGLNRYDGSRFVQYHSNDDSASLPTETLTSISWLDKNRLGVATGAGLHIVNTKTGETRNLFVPYSRKQYVYKFNAVMRVTGDSEGNIYVLSRSGFYQFDKNYKLVFRFDYYSQKELATEHFFFGEEMLELDKHRLLIVARSQLYIYDKGKKQLKKMVAADCPLMAEFIEHPVYNYVFQQQKAGALFILKSQSDSLVYINTTENKKVVSLMPIKRLGNEFAYRTRLIPLNDTTLYITSHFSGFFKMRFHPETGVVTLYPEKLFESYFCATLLRDKDNHLWVATNKGLLLQNPRKSYTQISSLPSGVQDSVPNIMLGNLDISGNKIYVAGRGGGALSIFNKNTFQFEKRIVLNHGNTRSNDIYTMAAVDSSNLILGTDAKLILFNRKSNREQLLSPPEWIDEDWTNDLFKDNNGNVWISGSGFLYRYNVANRSITKMPLNQQLVMMPVIMKADGNGNIWMGSHGLFHYNTTSNIVDQVIDSFPFIKMPDRKVNALLHDKQNTIWFNSDNNGLIAYNTSRQSFRHFTRKDGLPDDNIAAMIIVDGKLWIAAYSGLACMDLQSGHISRFGIEDGFPDLPVAKSAEFFYDSAAQHLYISFTKALVRFNPHQLIKQMATPHLFVENVLINGEKNFYLPGKNITTSWQNNAMMLTIGNINFLDGKSQGYAYRIYKNKSTPWQQLGAQPSFSISNLSPGKHIIQVKCFSLNNKWIEQVQEISIIVLPPFWLKPWFIGVMIAITAIIIFLLVRWRISWIRKQEMEKTHIQKLKADDYKNQFELEQISNYFSSSLSNKKTEEEVLWDVTNNLMRKMSYEDCVIYLWNKDKTKMVQKAAYGPKGKPEIISATVFEVMPGQGIVGEVIQTHKPLLIDDTRTDNRYRVDDAFRLSEVCVPIIHNNELLGAIDSEHSQPGYFGERDIKILTTIATLIGNKLKQIKSEQSLEVKQQELISINEQLAEAKLTALQAQMNPHFVFNALNSIKRMILEEENEKASRYLSKFALMIRMTLEHSKEVFVTLDENIKYLEAYLEMEQLRFNESFTYKICTDKLIDTDEILIPSLMIQPLVENAIWHGLMLSSDNKKISIAFTQLQDTITCTIEDNGIGIHQSAKNKEANSNSHKSVGLENLKRRINIINEKYNIHCNLTISDLNDIDKNKNGTRAVLKLNFLNV